MFVLLPLNPSASNRTPKCFVMAVRKPPPKSKANALTESNTAIVSGGVSLLTGNPGGGTAPYTISYFKGICNTANFVGSGASLLVSPTVTTSYRYNSIDSATTKNVVCSATNTVTVNPAQLATDPRDHRFHPLLFPDVGRDR